MNTVQRETKGVSSMVSPQREGVQNAVDVRACAKCLSAYTPARACAV